MKWWTKLGLYFQTRKEMQELFNEMYSLIDLQIDDVLNNIKELDQNKVYYVEVETVEEVEAVKNVLRRVDAKLEWTMPKILVMNIKLKKKR